MSYYNNNMVQIRDVGDIKEDEIDFLRTQTLGAGGYMDMYVNVGKISRCVHGKRGFTCDIITEYSVNGSLDCWAVLQNLLYRHEDYLDLSIWVPKAKRGKGFASKMLKFIAEQYKDKKIAVWVSVETDSVYLYKKFNKAPFYIFDNDVYNDTYQYKLFDFTKI
jgi:GNAT superfamily N-acetyltransferase